MQNPLCEEATHYILSHVATCEKCQEGLQKLISLPMFKMVLGGSDLKKIMEGTGHGKNQEVR
jgi:hypothetical protein